MMTREQFKDAPKKFGGDLWNEYKRQAYLFQFTDADAYVKTKHIGTGLYCTVTALFKGKEVEIYLSDAGFARLER